MSMPMYIYSAGLAWYSLLPPRRLLVRARREKSTYTKRDESDDYMHMQISGAPYAFIYV